MFSTIERESVLRAKFTQLQGSLRGIGTDAGIERIAETGRGLTNPAGAAKIGELFPPGCGPVAQLGARFHGMEEVIGSIPIRSTNKPNNLADSQKKRDTLSIRWFSCCILRSTFYDIPGTVQKNIDHAALRFPLG